MLNVKPVVHTLPSYSLTSDILNFQRCPRQYRYTKLARLPALRQVGFWYGLLIHGVLEECHRQLQEGTLTAPIPSNDLDEVIEQVDRHLAATEVVAWTKPEECLGKQRARTAVNELGPYLFPLIQQAEVRLRGARRLPVKTGTPIGGADLERYEMLGIVDVITKMSLTKASVKDNPLLAIIHSELGKSSKKDFEVIVDYKGAMRPDLDKISVFKAGYEKQVHIYGHLRGLMTKTPIKAGALIYLNELKPTKNDMMALRKACKNRAKYPDTILPEAGSDDETALLAWKPTKEKPPTLSFEFRLKRAVQVIPIIPATMAAALDFFDNTVAEIEVCKYQEANGVGNISSIWTANADNEDTCNNCDSQSYCDAYTKVTAPGLPG